MAHEGYSEVYSSVFAENGERQVLNKVGGERPYLRANLTDGLKDALERNARIKDVLGLKKVKLFEIGTVWSKNAEEMKVGVAEEKGNVTEYKFSDIPKPESYEVRESSTLEMYKAYSRFPYIVRDIAMWVPTGTASDSVLEILKTNSGPLLVRCELFDTFERGEKTSLAFRLVFQSFEKTLTDEEVSAIMKGITAQLQAAGYEIR